MSICVLKAGAGYTNEHGEKVAVATPELALSGIVLDAELTLATPENLWYAEQEESMSG